MIRFQCPSCQVVFKVADKHAGQKSDCVKCGQRLQVPVPPRKKTVLGKLLPERAVRAKALPPPLPPRAPQAGVPVAVVRPAEPEEDWTIPVSDTVRPAAVQVNINGVGVAPPGNGLAVAGMVLGILSLCFFCVFFVALPLAALAIPLSAVGIHKANRTGTGLGMAITGLITGCLAVLATLAVFAKGMSR